MIDLDQLEALAKAATPGPWRVGSYPAEIVGDTHVCIDTKFGAKVLLRGNENFYEEARANAAFSAAADRDTVLTLIAEVRALREDAERYRFARESIQEGYALPGGFYLSESGGESWDNTIDAARKEPT